MYCSKCGKEVKEGEQFCSNCGTSVKSGKTNNTTTNDKNKKLIIIGIIAVIIISIVIVLIKHNTSTVETGSNNSGLFGLGQKDEKGFEQSSANASANGTNSVSFKNMRADDENLSKEQQEILKYFDTDYFRSWSSKYWAQYPTIFKDTKVYTSATIVKVLKATDDEFEVLAVDQGGYTADYGYGEMNLKDLPEDQFIVITGKQTTKRLVKGDIIELYGRYINMNSYEIDGSSYILPQISTINLVDRNINQTVVEEMTPSGITYFDADAYHYTDRFTLDTVKTVAEYIFGKDIKISEPVKGQDYDENSEGEFYKVTLDNQSNGNFKVFNIGKEYGEITYNKIHNGLSDNTEKNLYVSADFQHYIVTTYDSNLKHAYVDYFDKDLKKLWGREFDYNSNKLNVASPLDYTEKQMAIVIDNDLYLLDLKTGENVIEPVMVGEKTKIIMMSDGIILVGNDNKDTVMKVGYDGKIIFRQNAGTEMADIQCTGTQVINGKLLVELGGYELDEFGDPIGEIGKYLVINNDGTVELSTDDL